MSVVEKKLFPNQSMYHQSIKPEIFVKPEKILKLKTDNQIIEFSNTEKKTHQTKNFIALHNAFPIKNREFNLVIQNNQEIEKPITLPIFKTNQEGIMFILVNPVFDNKGEFNRQASGYQPLKFSQRLGFVVKDTENFSKKNIFYAKKYIAKYIDLGISVDFLRTMIKKSHQGSVHIDASNNSVVQNWLNAFYYSDNVTSEYKKFNTHTERTAKAIRRSDDTYNALIGLGVTGLIVGGSIATVGLATPAIVAIGGGILAGGSSGSMVARHMEQQMPDISRLRDTKKTADKTLINI